MGEERGLGREVRVFLYCKLGMEGGSGLAGLDACVCTLRDCVEEEGGCAAEVSIKFVGVFFSFRYGFWTPLSFRV